METNHLESMKIVKFGVSAGILDISSFLILAYSSEQVALHIKITNQFNVATNHFLMRKHFPSSVITWLSLDNLLVITQYRPNYTALQMVETPN